MLRKILFSLKPPSYNFFSPPKSTVRTFPLCKTKLNQVTTACLTKRAQTADAAKLALSYASNMRYKLHCFTVLFVAFLVPRVRCLDARYLKHCVSGNLWEETVTFHVYSR